MGLGPCDLVSLAEARERALQARRQRYEGVDPIDARRATRAAARAAEQEAIARTMTFAACADAYFADHQAGWRNADHRTQWSSSIATYTAPIIGHLPVQTIDTALVLKVLKQPLSDGIFWTALPETAARVRGRIEVVLDWARAHRFCEGENPARWRGHLAQLLPPRKKLARVVHYPALSYAEIPAFMAQLRGLDGNAARALEFKILTAARSEETTLARWSEIDLANKLWTIPAERMKGDREHVVPLSTRALAILEQMETARAADALVFPSARNRPLASKTFARVLERLGRGDVTAHGFRSTFRDWAADCTNFPGEICETALAHVVGSKAEQAYRRTDLRTKRAALMQAWCEYCSREPDAKDTVVPMRRKHELKG
jgi:integrase